MTARPDEGGGKRGSRGLPHDDTRAHAEGGDKRGSRASIAAACGGGVKSRMAAVAALAVLLLSLPLLYISVGGFMAGSFEWFPRPADVSVKRGLYALVTVLILLADAGIGVGLAKRCRVIGRKKKFTRSADGR